jgi:IS30 family transposase
MQQIPEGYRKRKFHERMLLPLEQGGNSMKHDSTHLTLEERKVIEVGIENGTTKKTISETIGKDPTTVAKEIRAHRKLKPRNTYNRPILCEKRRECKKKPCVTKCEDFVEPKCRRRDVSPGACNKCESVNKCVLDKYLYSAEIAHDEYRRDLVDYREGINLTTKERDALGEIIAPLLKKGQSVQQILSAHPEISQSERTMYYYIESGVFKPFGVDCFSLKEQVQRKKFKEKYKKRKEPACYKGHTYADYVTFREKHPDIPPVEMDTVYNAPSGPYLQTIMLTNVPFMFGFIHANKTSESMAERVSWLQERLGAELFSKLLSLILTDRGPEFEKIKLFELDRHGASRLNIFYCDPMQSSQKPHIENNHNYVRDIIPNAYPLDSISQADIDLMFSHINSTPRRSLSGKTPYELFTFLYGRKTAVLLNILEIPRDDVTLKPSLVFSKSTR